MTSSLENKWNNFSDIDIELFKLINKIARENDCSYYLIGAKARDMLLDYFDKIKNAFVNNSDFTVNEKIEHRFMSTKYGYLDINVNRPIPAILRYKPRGQPSPPIPTIRTLLFDNFI